MIVGVDAGCLGIKDERLRVGVYQVAKNLFHQLAKLDIQNTYLLYSFYPIEKILLKNFGKNVKNIVVKPARGWTKIWLPLQLLYDKPDIFVGLNQSLPLKLPGQKYKTIVMIHDVLFEQYPKMYPGSFRKLHKESRSAAQNADIIIVPSEATKRDIEKFYKISPGKISVIYEGVKKFPKVEPSGKTSMARAVKGSTFLTSNPYFLFVGALKPQKNVPLLLKAFSKISLPRRQAGNIKYQISNIQLLVVGGDKWRDKEIDKTMKELPDKVKTQIKFLGIVDEATLASLYKNAIAFVSPSLSEGFGLTFLESLSFGVSVIGPKTGAVPEVVGNAGILIDPTSVKELQKAMEKMLDSKIRSRFQKKTKAQASKFSWEEFTSGYLHTLQILDKPE